VATAGSGVFFDVLYLQDATGGISVFGTVPSDKVIPLGAVLQVTGVVDEYNGDIELKFNDFYQDFVWQGWTPPVLPMTLDTGSAMLPANEGWLVETTGLVTQILDAGSCLIDDGSGPALIFVDGYIGQLPDGLQVGDTLSAVGLAGEFAGGHRLRVRNPSELVIIPSLDLVSGWNMISLPLVLADPNPDAVFPAGWPLFLWDAVQGSYRDRSQITLAIGVGYWLKAPSAQVLPIEGQSNPSALHLIPLSTGWNLIGAPFYQQIPWDSIHVLKAAEVKTLNEAMLAGWIKGPFYRWTGSAYESINSGGIFQPTSGYWLKGLQNGCTLEVAKP
jgi:hypothetical protein